MRWLSVVAVAGALLAVGQAAAQSEGNPRVSLAGPPQTGSTLRPIALTRIGSQLRDDQVVGKYLSGTVCVTSEKVFWKDIAGDFVNLKEVFGEELKATGFKPDADPGDLFADTRNSATDLQVGAMIKSVASSYCDDLRGVSGTMTLSIQWQVYSTLRREVVATIDTSGTLTAKGLGRKEQVRSLGQLAFVENVKVLLGDPRFREIVTAPDPAAPSVANTTRALQSMRLAVGRAEPVSMAQAAGSVVSVFAGSGHGSGVLVSSDGYILTNEHVVGTATTVRVRWSDGFETAGVVERTDKRRDVALVKTQPRGRMALALNTVIPPLGAPVFAIGTPLDPQLQNTVTRGVVSATRIIDGFNFIQSDTPVTFGNSGGPLLDEKGAVVGITSSGMDPSKGSALNFFIPIGDALDFLALIPGA